MYILTNDKLSKSQAAVQACHAVAEYMHEFGQNNDTINWVKNDKTMVVLKASEKEMYDISKKFSADYMKGSNPEYWVMFYEPDMNNLLTAIAFEPMEEEVGNELFFNFKLL